MRRGTLESWPILNEKGVTLIELLVVLVISGAVVGGVYKVFIAQTKAYTVQDQVAEVQQDVRGAMEIMARDIRMAGYQTNNFASLYPASAALISTNQIVTPLNSGSIQVYYEYNPSSPQVYAVTYSLTGTTLNRTLTIFTADPVNPTQVSNNISDLLDNVQSLNFMYAVDANGDGIVDGINTTTGIIPDYPNNPNHRNNPFQTYTAVNGTVGAKIFAVEISLTANPASTDPDVNKIVTPRFLSTVVTPRNIFFKRYQAY